MRGLTDDQLAARATVSELTLGGIVNHLTRGERSWTHVLSSGTGGTPPGMFDMEQYESPPGVSATALLAAYEEAARHRRGRGARRARPRRAAARGTLGTRRRPALAGAADRAAPAARDGTARRARRHRQGGDRRGEHHGAARGLAGMATSQGRRSAGAASSGSGDQRAR
ncbi:mycothiol transferase [Streptomyces aureocirculatus]|uniref:mycothiol transferase n=1 Tax=Streptomyces aureocirculatus TaxID=67275 RepID=UPI00385102F9